MKIPAHILRSVQIGLTTTSLAVAVGCTSDKAPEPAERDTTTAEAADEQAEADDRDLEQQRQAEVDRLRREAEAARLAELSEPPLPSPFLKGAEPPEPPPVQTPNGNTQGAAIQGDGPGPVVATPPPQPVVTHPINDGPGWAAACGRG